MADVQAGDALWLCQDEMDMIALTNEDLLDGWDRPTGAGETGEDQAVHLMKEEKMADVTDDMVQEVDGPFSTDEDFHFVIQKS